MLTLSGDAAVLLRHNAYDEAVTTATHVNDEVTDLGAAHSAYGYVVPSGWPAPVGIWLRGHIITYDSNGGTGAPPPMVRLTGTVEHIADVTAPTRPGYVCTGWNTKADGSGFGFTAASTYSFARDMTLYAQWRGNAYTVQYNANGGGGMMADSAFNYGTAGNLRTNGFTKAGSLFVGWG